MAYIEWHRGEELLAVRVQKRDIPWGNVASGMGEEIDGITEPSKPDAVVVDPEGLHRKAVQAVKDAVGRSPAREKGVFVELGSRALFFINGRYEGELPQGAQRLDKFEEGLDADLRVFHPTVVLVDAAETWLEFKVLNMASADDQNIDVFVQLAFKLVDPATFFVNVMKSRGAYREADLRQVLFQPLRGGVEQFVHGRDGAELAVQSDQTRQDLFVALEASCRSVLQRTGFELIDVNVFRTEAALEAAARFARERRREARQQLADEHADDDVAGERADWDHERARRDRDRETRAATQAEAYRRQDAEVELERKDWQAGHDQRNDLRDLDDRRRRIDTWARFADEMIRKKVLEQHHSLEEIDRLEQVAQDFEQLGALRKEEWADFQRDLGWKKLRQEWEDHDRKQDRGLEAHEQDAERKQKAATAARHRAAILTKLDETLATELRALKMEQGAEIDRLKLELARRQIEEQLGHDRVQEEARQDLERLIYGGKAQRQQLEQGLADQQREHDQDVTEQTLAFHRRTSALKQALGTDQLRYEVELAGLRAEITLAGVDQAEAENLLASVRLRGETEQLDHELAASASKLEASLRQRRASFDADLAELVERRRAEREQRLADEQAQTDGTTYAEDQALDLLRKKQQIESEAKWDKLERLGKLAEFDRQIDEDKFARETARAEQQHQHAMALKQAEMDEVKVRLDHESGIERLRSEQELARIQAEVDGLAVKAQMSADQLEAIEGMEGARIEAHRARAREEYVEELKATEQARREDVERFAEQARGDNKAMLQAVIDANREAQERLERMHGRTAEEVRRAGAASGAREAAERARDDAMYRERVGDLKEGRSEAIGAIKDVAQEKVASPRVEVHSGGHGCHACGASVTVSQALCPNCGQPLK